MKRLTREELVEVVKQLVKTETCLATVGHILRDEYLVLDLREYNLKLKQYSRVKLDYEIYERMKNLSRIIPHTKKHRRDTNSRVVLQQKVAALEGLITFKKKQKALTPEFVWTLETNEKLLGKYAG